MRRIILLLLAGMVATLVPPGAEPNAAATDGFEHLVGGLHTHTGYSDGVPGTTPADAYATARDVEDLDFMAVTEHSEALLSPTTLSEGCLEDPDAFIGCALADPDPLKSVNKWDAQRLQATHATSLQDGFTGLRGFEWTSDVHGHINVYFSRNYTTRAEGGEVALEAFYEWLQRSPLAGGGADGIATFNHPGDKEVVEGHPAANWDDLAYRPELDDRFVGMEVFNRTRDRYLDWYVKALDNGWHLGAVGAEDIHESNWGSDDYAKTVIMATGRTLAELEDAMRQRRFYAVMDRDVRIHFEADGRPMGSRVVAPTESAVPLHVRVDGGDVAAIEIISNGGATTRYEGRETVHTINASSAEQYAFVRVEGASGETLAYSSPIWIRNQSSVCREGLLGTVCVVPGERPFAPRWVAGDLHVHTTYSHDSYGGPHDHNTEAMDCSEDDAPWECDYDAYTLGWAPGEQLAIAESRGLDFLAITDHNNTLGVYDPAWNSDTVIPLPGYENSLPGHAQMLGAVSCYAPSGRTDILEDCHRLLDAHDPAQVRALADAIRADGGVFQINHPSDMDWVDTYGDGSATDPIVPDSVEVWNIGAWIWQPPAPSANDNDYSLRFWETYLDAGHQVAATGGSDNHWRSTTAGQGVGQPTTWVWVTEPGYQGILDGIQAGRTTISFDPPAYAGPRLFLDADADGDGTFEAMVGDTVPAGVPMRIRAENLPPGAFYRINVPGEDDVVVTPAGAEYVTTVPDTPWVYVEARMPDAREPRTTTCDPVLGGQTTLCRNRMATLALTSPLYVS